MLAVCNPAGKSTVFHLLERFYEADTGSVLLDGADVRDVSHAWLHAVVGLVSQEPVRRYLRKGPSSPPKRPPRNAF